MAEHGTVMRQCRETDVKVLVASQRAERELELLEEEIRKCRAILQEWANRDQSLVAYCKAKLEELEEEVKETRMDKQVPLEAASMPLSMFVSMKQQLFASA